MKQDPPPFKRLAPPPRLAENSRASVYLAKLPARLIPAPAALPVSHPQPRQRQVVPRAGVIGIALDGRFVRLQGLRHAAKIQQRVAAIRCGGLVPQSLRPFKGRHRIRKSPLGMQQNALHVHCFRLHAIAR